MAVMTHTRERIVLADLIPGALVRDLLLVIAGAALTGVCAQISIPLPGTPVPVTGQTFAVLLTGAALGGPRALLAMALYLVAGVAGVPWFAGGAHGWVAATGGYLAGFAVAAAVVGVIARRGGDRTVVRTAVTMLIGTALIYALGVAGLMLSLSVGAAKAFGLGVRPFLIGDAIKLLLAAGLLPGTWRLAGRRGS